VAGIATYVLAGELALGRVLAGELPRPQFPPMLRRTAPETWFRLAAGALHFAEVHAGREDRVATTAAVLGARTYPCWGGPAGSGSPAGCETGTSRQLQRLAHRYRHEM
jgi:hypothetical protein